MDEKYNINSTLLKEPLSFRELIKDGSRFELEDSGFNRFAFDEDDGDGDDETDYDIDSKELASPWEHTFEELRKLMQPVSEHIYKRKTRQGAKERGLVPDKARVTVRYSAYWEKEGAPFDSSLLRGTNFEFETGCRMVIGGLEAAVRTMYPYERAEFIIAYQLLLGEMGCPPRVKPKADALFLIEVISYTLVGDAEALEQVRKEDRDKFELVYPKVQDIHLQGKDCVKRGAVNQAIKTFDRAIMALNYCRLANEEDERKQAELLTTLYTNLAICYNKVNKPQRVCIIMKQLRRLTNDQLPCKALFQEGRALVALGEYQHGRLAFLKAQALQPKNKEISDAIIKLNNRVSKYQEVSRELWTRAIGGKKKSSQLPGKQEKQQAKDTEFADNPMLKTFEDMVKDFVDGTVRSIKMSCKTYTEEEIRVLRHVAKLNNVKVQCIPNENDCITLWKTD